MGTSVQVHSHRDKGLSPGLLALGSWVWVPGRRLITKYLSPAHSLFLSGRGNPSAWRDLGSGLGVTWLRRGAGRRPHPKVFPPIQVGPLWKFWALLGKAEEAERKAHISVHPSATAVTLRKGLGALRWSECLEFSESGVKVLQQE